jgi:XTP/dITP diphosphohydrolase
MLRSVCALGTFEGSIALAPSGASGFGYDPIFIPKGASSSVAELPAQEKDALSHRGDALRLLTPVLQWLNGE